MEYFDLLVVERKDWGGNLLRRYALCPGCTAVPGDLITLHGDPDIYQVTHTFSDPLGDYAEVATAMNPIFYVQRHWSREAEFSLAKEEGGAVVYGPV